MTALAIQDIRAFVWSYLDLSSEDIPTTLVDGWIADGDRRIARRTKKLPYFESAATVITTVGVSSYAIPSVTVGSFTPKLKDIVSMSGPKGPLAMMDKADADEKFYSLTPQNSWPRAFAVWGDRIIFYPTPDATYSYTVTGYRERTDWMTGGAGATPDLPVDFHELVREWALYKAHEHQDDPERAQLAKVCFSEGLAELIADETQAPPGTPIVMNGGRRTYRTAEDRLLYPWE